MGVRLKRIAAFFIDWNLIWLPALCVVWNLLSQKEASQLLLAISFLGAFCGMFVLLAVVVLRDWLLRGRSLGKRIFGLYVYDQETLQKACPKQLFLRNVFFFLYPVDGILLLITGRTVGDRAANTVVLTKDGLEDYKVQQSMPKPERAPWTRKKTLLVCGIVALVLIIFMGMLQIGLAGKKEDPGYDIAYQYLVESYAFERLNTEESKIRLTHYYEQSVGVKNDVPWSKTISMGFGEDIPGDTACVQMEESNRTIQYTFGVGLRTFRVVCHNENGVLQVCPQCTRLR